MEHQKTFARTGLIRLLKGVLRSACVGPKRYTLMLDLGVTSPPGDTMTGTCEWQQDFDGELHVGDVVVFIGAKFTRPAYMPNPGVTMWTIGGQEYIVTASGRDKTNQRVYRLRYDRVNEDDPINPPSKVMTITEDTAVISPAPEGGTAVEPLRGLDESYGCVFPEDETDIPYLLENLYEGLDDPELTEVISKKDALILAGYAYQAATRLCERYGGKVIIAGETSRMGDRPAPEGSVTDEDGKSVLLHYGDILVVDNKPFRYLGDGEVTYQEWQGEYIEEWREETYKVTQDSTSIYGGDRYYYYTQLPNGRYADGSKNGGTESSVPQSNVVAKLTVSGYKYKTLWVKNTVQNPSQSVQREALFAENAGWEPVTCVRKQTVDGVATTTYHTQQLPLPAEGHLNNLFIASTKLEDTEYTDTVYSSGIATLDEE